MEPKQRKRRDAAGCLVQRKDTEIFYLYYYDAKGNYKGKSLSTKNPVVAERRRREIMAGVQSEIKNQPAPDLSDLSEFFKAHPNLSPLTVRNYKIIWNKFVNLGLDMFKNYSPFTIKVYIVSLRGILKWYQARNEYMHISLPDKIQCDYPLHADIITDDQYYKLLDHAPNMATRLMIALCGFAGLRSTEAGNLLISEVNLESRLLRIQGHAENPYCGIQFSKTKNGKMRRVSICDPLLNLLKPIVEGSHKPGDYVIQHAKHIKRFPYVLCARELKIAAKAAGIDPKIVTRHGLRHYYATFLIKSGKATIYDIKSALGHSEVKTTEQMYLHMDGVYNERLNAFPMWITPEERDAIEQARILKEQTRLRHERGEYTPEEIQDMENQINEFKLKNPDYVEDDISEF